MRKRLAMTVFLALLSAVPANAKRVTHRVTVDGVPYRVTIKAGEATVARKTLIVIYDIAERDRQREAAVKATGCRLADEMPTPGGVTVGKLDCSK